MKREVSSDRFPIGSTLPAFNLKGALGKGFDSETAKIDRGLLVVFTCNHCPYVKGSEGELIEIARKYAAEGLTTITINSNDPNKYPEDNFENMEKKARELNLPYAYLFDDTQQAAKKFDAACTPECYLFDSSKKLVYHGAINDNPKDRASAKHSALLLAVEQLLAGKVVDPNYVHPMGCSIKWK